MRSSSHQSLYKVQEAYKNYKGNLTCNLHENQIAVHEWSRWETIRFEGNLIAIIFTKTKEMRTMIIFCLKILAFLFKRGQDIFTVIDCINLSAYLMFSFYMSFVLFVPISGAYWIEFRHILATHSPHFRDTPGIPCSHWYPPCA